MADKVQAAGGEQPIDTPNPQQIFARHEDSSYRFHMVLQKEHRFSVIDYYRMAETGVLLPGDRVELLDGRIIDISPIGPFHGGVVKRLSRFYQLKAKERCIVSTQDPLQISEESEPQPDIMLLKPKEDFYASGHPRPNDVLLLIEVSDSSIDYDRGEKLSAYARAGVPEVWIINLNEQNIERYLEPTFTGYASNAILREGEHAAPQAFPDTAFDIAQLFKR